MDNMAQLVLNGGIGGFAIAGFVLFLRYLSKRDAMDAEREKCNQAFLTNHLSTYTKSMSDMQQAMSAMARSIERCPHRE